MEMRAGASDSTVGSSASLAHELYNSEFVQEFWHQGAGSNLTEGRVNSIFQKIVNDYSLGFDFSIALSPEFCRSFIIFLVHTLL